MRRISDCSTAGKDPPWPHRPSTHPDWATALDDNPATSKRLRSRPGPEAFSERLERSRRDDSAPRWIGGRRRPSISMQRIWSLAARRRKTAAATLLHMTDKASQEQRRLGQDSERLLDSLDELRSLEQEKRRERISTDRFHQLAEEVTEVASDIFRDASREEIDGNRTDRSDRTIDETV